MLGGSPLATHTSHCRVACLLACWDRGPPAWEAAEVWEILLGKGKGGTPCYANISPLIQKRKNGEIWPTQLNPFAFYGPYYLRPAVYLLQSLNASGKLMISEICWLTALYLECFSPTQMISSWPRKNATM